MPDPRVTALVDALVPVVEAEFAEADAAAVDADRDALGRTATMSEVFDGEDPVFLPAAVRSSMRCAGRPATTQSRRCSTSSATTSTE